jgi:hypothetical protein
MMFKASSERHSDIKSINSAHNLGYSFLKNADVSVVLSSS